MTDVSVHVAGDYVAGAKLVLVVNRGEPFSLPGTDFALRVDMHCRIVPADARRDGWKLTTVAYIYALLERGGREILRYDYHPHIGPKHPHVHVAWAAWVPSRIRRAHLPTARVALEDVLALVLGDLKARARRNNWPAVLHRTREGFLRGRTWA